MNLNSAANLNRRGRRAAFTEAQAFEILEARVFGFQNKTRVWDFIEAMVGEQIIKERCHPHTMLRLINGKTFPGLRNPETGQPYDYSKVPKFLRGVRKDPHADLDAGEELHGTPKVRNRFPKLRQQMLDSLREETRIAALGQYSQMEYSFRAMLLEETRPLLEQIRKLQGQVEKLEKPAPVEEPK